MPSRERVEAFVVLLKRTPSRAWEIRVKIISPLIHLKFKEMLCDFV